jgi:hypothetical protein
MARTGRPKKDKVMQVLAVRLPEELLQFLDRHAATLMEENPGMEVSRAGALRMVLAIAMKDEKPRRKSRG